MTVCEKRMVKFLGDDCKMAIKFELPEAKCLLIMVVQDDSCFASNEGQKSVWIQKDKNILKPNGSGRSLMASEFLCEFHGRLELDEEQKR
jgi:hypothetical protein